MFLLLLALARADSAETGDTGPYVDTDAQSTLVYRQEEGGCGGGKSAWLLLPVAGLMLRNLRRDS